MATLTTRQEYRNVRVTVANDRGEAANIDGVPAWTSSDPAVVTVAPSVDGLSGVITAVGVGTARVTVSADSAVGDGVSELTGISEDITVTADVRDRATSLTINLGTPTDRV